MSQKLSPSFFYFPHQYFLILLVTLNYPTLIKFTPTQIFVTSLELVSFTFTNLEVIFTNRKFYVHSRFLNTRSTFSNRLISIVHFQSTNSIFKLITAHAASLVVKFSLTFISFVVDRFQSHIFWVSIYISHILGSIFGKNLEVWTTISFLSLNLWLSTKVPFPISVINLVLKKLTWNLLVV